MSTAPKRHIRSVAVGDPIHVDAVYGEERIAFILSGLLLGHEYLEHEANVGRDLLSLHSGDRSEVAGE